LSVFFKRHQWSPVPIKPLNILLVDGSSDYSALVSQWLCGDPSLQEFKVIWSDSLASAIFRLEKGDIDLILVELGLPDSEGIETFNALRGRAELLPIIVLGAGDNQALALQTIRHGAEDYLVKPTCTAELLIRTLRHSAVRHQVVIHRNRAQECPNVARVIGVLGGTGGAGATTVACVLAQELRHQTGQATLLMDLDTNPGLVGFAMGVDPQFTVQDLATNTSRLDWSLWDGIVMRHKGGADILASSKTVEESDPDIDGLRKIISFASNYYRWIVMDLGRLNRTTRQLLPGASDVVLVSAQDIPALQQCKHAIGILRGAGIEGKRVRLILNRIHDDQQLSRGELENLFGMPITAILPPAHRDLWDAYLTKRRRPSVAGSFRAAVTDMTRKMAGLADEEPKRPSTSFAPLTDIFRHKNAFAITR
jgi:Flp pilus assembly CpaE family ATPase